MSNILTRRINRFKNTIKKNNGIQKFFNIPESDDNNISFKLTIKPIEINNNLIVFELKYKYQYDTFYFEIFPCEINDHINSFCFDILILEISMVFLKKYPFNPTFLIISNTYTNKNNYYIINFYSSKLKKFNYDYKKNWSMVCLIDKQILDFIAYFNTLEPIWMSNYKYNKNKFN